ncbi:MAG: glycoside hydrolase family 5 protein [Verrucomicrobiota bacterium]
MHRFFNRLLPLALACTLATAEAASPELKTVGNKIVVAATGEPVLLRGLNVPSLEWNPEGQAFFRLLEGALDWNANIIRVPVKSKYWFGREDTKERGADEAYRWIVDRAIETAAARGAYVILDLHHYRAPDQDAVDFWKDAAERYRNNPAVLFGVFNEAFSTSWDVWLNGGPVEYRDKKADETVRYESVGMQALVDTIRGTGARNIVIVGGLEWAYDLTGVAAGHEIDQRDGHGLVYDAHIYNWKRDWMGKVMCVADQHPILVGEWGADHRDIPGTGTTASTLESPEKWVPAFLGFAQKHGLHWTAWSFHPRAGPHVIDRYDMIPTPYFGAFVKAALQGEKFDESETR